MSMISSFHFLMLIASLKTSFQVAAGCWLCGVLKKFLFYYYFVCHCSYLGVWLQTSQSQAMSLVLNYSSFTQNNFCFHYTAGSKLSLFCLFLSPKFHSIKALVHCFMFLLHLKLIDHKWITKKINIWKWSLYIRDIKRKKFYENQENLNIG